MSESIEQQLTRHILEDHGLRTGQRVEVELLVGTTPIGAAAGIVVPRILEGRVVGATGRILLLDGSRTDVRIPWPAIAAIRDAVEPHPATT